MSGVIFSHVVRSVTNLLLHTTDLQALKLLGKLTDGDLNELCSFCVKALIREFCYGVPNWKEWKHTELI